MTKQIAFYLDGMVGWTKLSVREQLWVFTNREEMVPRGAMLFFMAQ